MTDKAPVAPWYRQPWFWFLTIFPLASILWGVTMLIISASLETSMVSDDYSKEGRGINMAIARDHKAAEMGIEGELSFEGRKADLALTTRNGAADYPYVILNLYHPTLSENDRVIQFQRLANGEYSGRLLEDLTGRWYYDLQSPENDWRVKGEIRLPATQAVILSAGSESKD